MTREFLNSVRAGQLADLSPSQNAVVPADTGAVGPDARLDPNLVRQIRATFMEVIDAALEDPQQRAARRAALKRRRSRRSDVKPNS